MKTIDKSSVVNHICNGEETIKKQYFYKNLKYQQFCDGMIMIVTKANSKKKSHAENT